MRLETISQLAQIAGSISIVIAIIFGVGQVRQYRQQRRDIAAMELMRIIQDSEFLRAYRLMYTLPPDASAEQVKGMGAHVEEAALVIAARFETLGLLVFRGNVPFDMLEEQVGGATVDFWRILGRWVREQREMQGQPLFLEWFQWLAERLAARRDAQGRPQHRPAYEQHKQWTPP